ncbi:MAG: hypothetical protein DI598_07065 [Pseudopedobacter saltans]|uniref:4-alpha-glucanotransferase n=1 Tax=Pseudopedobacter saltans TaxID=151895 RepID=A0A2W5GVB0_9SPHI|nr:MAG: hypothetical protein DI598_07065 [Pseudopedobacter saltans]
MKKASPKNDKKVEDKIVTSTENKKKATSTKVSPQIVTDKENIAKPKEPKAAKEKKPSVVKVKKTEKPTSSKREAIVKTKTTSYKVRLILELQYHTNPGESIWITSSGLLLGDSVLKQMVYHDNDHWRLELELDPSQIKEDIPYRYHIKNTDGSFQDDYEEKRISLKSLKFPFLFIRDFWSYAGYHENVYYKKPFDFLIQRDLSVKIKDLTTTTTHVFQVKVAYLKPNEGVCVIGSEPFLGAWDNKDFQKLQYDSKSRVWKGLFNLKDFSSHIKYKYGIYNKDTNELVALENGDNRNSFSLYEKGLVVQNDGFIRLDEKGWKGAGLNIPLFSIRSEKDFGIGDLGSIKTIVDWMSSVGLKLLQLLPINDTTVSKTWKDSYPYSSISVFALHPIYIDLDALFSDEDKQKTSIKTLFDQKENLNSLSQLDYESVYKLKWQLVVEAYKLYKKETVASSDFKIFVKKNENWLKAYAAFSVLRDEYGNANYEEWKDATQYSDAIFDQLFKSKKDKILICFYVQYILSKQLLDAVQYAHDNQIVLKGDIPIGVDRHSADVWQYPTLFNTTMQAGAPPDYFTKDGQNWGFPTYEWDEMEKDNYSWWSSRLSNMSQYFDAIRIDHILGFFRIWSIPEEQVQGILGYFQPCIPIEESEFLEWNIPFRYNRYCKPFINDSILNETFGDMVDYIKSEYLQLESDGTYSFIPAFDTQKKIKAQFDNFEYNAHNDWMQKSLLGLMANVLFIPDKIHGKYHCRFVLYETSSYAHLDDWEKKQLYYLYLNYYFERQNDFWKKIGYKQLSAITSATDMMICGEDLGMVPHTVPIVMDQLGVLGLKVQRMASDISTHFTNPLHVGFLNIVTPTTHDMPPIRNWWNGESVTIKELFYKTQLLDKGLTPAICDEYIVSQVVFNHLQSPALWSVFLIQDILAMDNTTANPLLEEDIINRPEVAHFYWRYRMHLSVEKLLKEERLNGKIKNLLQLSSR